MTFSLDKHFFKRKKRSKLFQIQLRLFPAFVFFLRTAFFRTGLKIWWGVTVGGVFILRPVITRRLSAVGLRQRNCRLWGRAGISVGVCREPTDVQSLRQQAPRRLRRGFPVKPVNMLAFKPGSSSLGNRLWAGLRWCDDRRSESAPATS